MTKRGRVNWAEMDARIRGRKTGWTAAEMKELEQDLLDLPDVGALAEPLRGDQPALAPRPAAGWSDDSTVN